MSAHTFKPGDTVKLRPRVSRAYGRRAGEEHHDTATIHVFLSDVPGGVVLDRRMRGFRCWNVADLLPAK